jgi:hypothetical protein
MTSLNALRERARIANEELAAAEAIIEQPEKDLATLLHLGLCRWNHTDGCGWYYHEDSWTEHSHAQYLNRARAVLALTDDVPAALALIGAALDKELPKPLSADDGQGA